MNNYQIQQRLFVLESKLDKLLAGKEEEPADQLIINQVPLGIKFTRNALNTGVTYIKVCPTGFLLNCIPVQKTLGMGQFLVMDTSKFVVFFLDGNEEVTTRK